PDAPAYRTRSVRVRFSTTNAGISAPSAKRPSVITSLLDRLGGLDGGVAKVRHHLAALVLEFRLADDEGHRAAAPSLLLEHVLGARAEGEHVAGADGAHVLELLLAVEEPAVVELHGAARLAQIAQPVGHRHE